MDLESVSQDPVTIMANLPPWDIEEAKTRVPKNYKLDAAVNGWLEQDKANYGKDVLEKAALHAETAHVVVIGLLRNGKVEQLYTDTCPAPVPDVNVFRFPTEAELLEHAFMRLNEGSIRSVQYGGGAGVNAGLTADEKVMAWNLDWDLKIMVQRAWILGVPVPNGIYNPMSRYSVPDRFVCLMQKYGVDRQSKYSKLSTVAKLFGFDGKLGDGKDFGEMWKADKAAALAYNERDLRVTAEIAKRMGAL